LLPPLPRVDLLFGKGGRDKLGLTQIVTVFNHLIESGYAQRIVLCPSPATYPSPTGFSAAHAAAVGQAPVLATREAGRNRTSPVLGTRQTLGHCPPKGEFASSSRHGEY
jgi:hypothetical protein